MSRPARPAARSPGVPARSRGVQGSGATTRSNHRQAAIHVRMSNVLRTGLGHADLSVTVPAELPLFVAGTFGFGRIPTGAGECSPFSPSGDSQRTSSAGRACHGERGTEHQELSPQAPTSKGRSGDEDSRQQKAAHCAPPRNARKRHAVKPAAALDHCEDAGEYDAGSEAERCKHEGKGEVGVETAHPRQHDARTKPCPSSREAHPGSRADASPPFLHDELPVLTRTRVPRAGHGMPGPSRPRRLTAVMPAAADAEHSARGRSRTPTR